MTSLLLYLPGNERAALAVARELGCPAAAIELHRFPDGECSLRLPADVAGMDVAVVCTLDRPGDKLAALLFAADLARDLGAFSVGLLAPYLAYMRQDARFNPGESVTARYFARLISANFDWLVTADPHLHRIATLESVYSVPAIAVRAAPAIAAWIKQHVPHAGLVGPDAESRQWVAEVADLAGAPFLVLDKVRRGDHDVTVSVPDAPWLRQCTPVIIDDIASTGRTLAAAIRAVTAAGGVKPHCVVVHAVFADRAIDQLMAAGAARITSCDTVVHASNDFSIDRELAVAVRQALEMMAARRRYMPPR